MDIFEESLPTKTGIRLERLEIQNWGTFDKEIFSLDYSGESSLLIGKNATGKTTISDAILSLVVESSRNFNVSASAYGKRTGRNKSSYIKGAYKEVSQEGQIQSTPDHLRPEEGTLSLLMAVFKNYAADTYLTIAQIMYIARGKETTLYCFRESPSSILKDLSNFKGIKSITRELSTRGFTVVKPGAYYEKLRSWTGMRPQALDVFNQTVAVKEIRNLNEFIRRYMLDAKDYDTQVQEIIRHYADLDTAYQQILRNEEQLAALEPINSKGTQYQEGKVALLQLESDLNTRNYFFERKKMEVFGSAIEQAEAEIATLEDKKSRLGEEIDELDDKIADLTVESKTKGGLYNQLKAKKREKVREHDECVARLKEFNNALDQMDIAEHPKDEVGFLEVTKGVRALQGRAQVEYDKTREEAFACSRKLSSLKESKAYDEEQLEALRGRKSNVPLDLTQLRQSICDALSIETNRMPFAAELIQVKSAEEKWKPAAELVLGSFARTLLVPPELHRSVVEYAERNRLKDALGKGMLLAYEKTDPDDDFGMRSHGVSGPDYLAGKLEFKQDHDFGSIVMREIRNRFPYRCFEDISAFHDYRDPAVTIQGQVRAANGRIRKDDRDKSRNPKNYILGWDNEDKRCELAKSIDSANNAIAQMTEKAEGLAAREEYWSKVKYNAPTVLRHGLWDELDTTAHQARVDEVAREMEEFRKKNTALAEIEAQIAGSKVKRKELDAQRQRISSQQTKFGVKIEGWKNGHTIAKNESRKQSTPASEDLERVAGELQNHYLMTVESVLADDSKSREQFEGKRRDEARDLDTLESSITKAMALFLEKFKSDGFWQHLSDEITDLGGFQKEYAKIHGHNLPEHKERFRKMARDRLQNDLGQLNQELRNADADMKERIHEINQALREIKYNAGTYMELRYLNAKFHQRDTLKKYLKDALDQQMGMGGHRTFEEAESFFKTIEPFIRDLKDQSWAKNACDVRNWYDFAAREKRLSDDVEVRSHQSSDKDSGGEKAKLAFTILVAALTYQYDLDLQNPRSEKFRFAVIDEAFAKVDDVFATYALELFKSFGLQVMIVAPLDPKALIVLPYVEYCVMTVKRADKDEKDRSKIFTMTKKRIQEKIKEADAD